MIYWFIVSSMHIKCAANRFKKPSENFEEHQKIASYIMNLFI